MVAKIEVEIAQIEESKNDDVESQEPQNTEQEQKKKKNLTTKKWVLKAFGVVSVLASVGLIYLEDGSQRLRLIAAALIDVVLSVLLFTCKSVNVDDSVTVPPLPKSRCAYYCQNVSHCFLPRGKMQSLRWASSPNIYIVVMTFLPVGLFAAFVVLINVAAAHEGYSLLEAGLVAIDICTEAAVVRVVYSRYLNALKKHPLVEEMNNLPPGEKCCLGWFALAQPFSHFCCCCTPLSAFRFQGLYLEIAFHSLISTIFYVASLFEFFGYFSDLSTIAEAAGVL